MALTITGKALGGRRELFEGFSVPVPPELDRLILDCLEKDPTKRPATAAELRARLQTLPVSVPWTHERAEKWWSSNLPGRASVRPVADIVLSQEARPVRVIQPAC